MNAYDRAYHACKQLLARGVYPTPTRLNVELGRSTGRRKMNMLNGAEVKARTVVLQEAGYFKDDRTGRWQSSEVA